MPGLDAWVLSKPHAGDIAGGDIHYLSSCATGRIGRILIADMAGHGEKVALLATRLRGLMRRYVNYVDQKALAGEMNREFVALVDPGRFATAIVATFWGPTGELDLTIAGHPTPMVYRASGRTWELLGGQREAKSPGPESEDNIPLGIFDATTYGHEKVRLGRDDALLLYTDALIEARNQNGAFIGEVGLLRMLTEIARSAPVGDGFVLSTYQRLQEFTGGLGLDDDATILLLKPNAIQVPKGSIAMSLRAGRRLGAEFISSVWARLRGERRPFAMPELRKDNILGSLFDRFNAR